MDASTFCTSAVCLGLAVLFAIVVMVAIRRLPGGSRRGRRSYPGGGSDTGSSCGDSGGSSCGSSSSCGSGSSCGGGSSCGSSSS
ncbi:hypothetical protein [Fodinicola acaciae]|uniref:hypothetical protein n=1 Tax=Fodinicola acaciae TaxID=2681555 RepID=UPI0016524200|nr:hypothetical protein [Fodinicola acaciae]